jgi:hypothetical protein
MYGLDPNIQLGFLRGKTLEQACFGLHDLILHFDQDISISIESSIAVGQHGQTLVRHRSYQEVSRELLHLLNKVVIEVHWTTEGTVSLVFDHGAIVEIYDDSVEFESYSINSGSGLIVV